MKTVLKLWKERRGILTEEQSSASYEMAFARKVGDPLLKKLDYSIL